MGGRRRGGRLVSPLRRTGFVPLIVPPRSLLGVVRRRRPTHPPDRSTPAFTHPCSARPGSHVADAPRPAPHASPPLFWEPARATPLTTFSSERMECYPESKRRAGSGTVPSYDKITHNACIIFFARTPGPRTSRLEGQSPKGQASLIRPLRRWGISVSSSGYCLE